MFTSDESIRIVRLVAQYQSITAAAERLNKVPSAISYTVRKLEESFGAKLFERRGCYIRLTEAGEYFIAHSKAILDDLQTLKCNLAIVQGGTEPELTVVVNNIVPRDAIIQFLCDLEAAYPTTRVTIRREVYNGCWDALYANKADIVVGAPHFVPKTDGITSVPLGNLAWDFLVGAGHPLAHATHILQNTELRKYPAVCIKDTSVDLDSMHAWLLEGQKPIFVPDFSMAVRLIARNVAIGYVPVHIRAAFGDAGLVGKSIQEQKHATRLFLAHRSDGIGKVRAWCVDYLLRPDFRAWLCGDVSRVSPRSEIAR
ncbi:putative DNA-binding transcriptional regulator [Caballeronia pedi]|uniref:DNA-binding transcriptional regulator n=1 Tax=Caballeronia pedi TaxID=1777141 RepID=A0A158AWW7_9BURK|nr:LysR family transcriptional regulator [Caballeronia pedi]SAK62243.1 putative DNA-binding transcriptional regulator [Caballeronia pedi]